MQFKTIDMMPKDENIELMEKLRFDISNSDDYNPTEWHGEELARRKKAAEDGEVQYIDWEKAKEEIRKEIS